jgi:antitoxin (DNA-binding transcriptional repressor) of toxin-antitoxin stability system
MSPLAQPEETAEPPALYYGSPKIINMHDAKTHLSALVDHAVAGEPFIIAKAGKPQVICYAYVGDTQASKRTGFMPTLEIPDDFDTYLQDEIVEMFGVSEQ